MGISCCFEGKNRKPDKRIFDSTQNTKRNISNVSMSSEGNEDINNPKINEVEKKFINIIYLLDTTRSMYKNKKIVYSIKNINDSLKKNYENIKFGFVLYKDFFDELKFLNSNQKHLLMKKLFSLEEVILLRIGQMLFMQ